jgi:hypothetical protein
MTAKIIIIYEITIVSKCFFGYFVREKEKGIPEADFIII